jgi:hypothetical protein
MVQDGCPSARGYSATALQTTSYSSGNEMNPSAAAAMSQLSPAISDLGKIYLTCWQLAGDVRETRNPLCQARNAKRHSGPFAV